jgi:recombination protein RecT
MASNATDLKNQVARRPQGNAPAVPGAPATVAALFKQLKPQLEQALPKHLTADRLLRVALFQLRQNTTLAKCDPMSLVAAVAQAAQLGLEPGILGHCYFVPYGNQVQFVLGYKGMIELARRSGAVKSIDAHEVCENDDFTYAYGLDSTLRHVPALKNRGKVYAYYAVMEFTSGGHAFAVMSIEDVEKFRQRSRAKDNGPWKTDYDAMAIKTVIRRLFRWMPAAVEMQEAIARDNAVVEKIEPLIGVDGDEGGMEIITSYPDGAQDGPTWEQPDAPPEAVDDPFEDDKEATA